jgi:hypothetical protein
MIDWSLLADLRPRWPAEVDPKDMHGFYKTRDDSMSPIVMSVVSQSLL